MLLRTGNEGVFVAGDEEYLRFDWYDYKGRGEPGGEMGGFINCGGFITFDWGGMIPDNPGPIEGFLMPDWFIIEFFFRIGGARVDGVTHPPIILNYKINY